MSDSRRSHHKLFIPKGMENSGIEWNTVEVQNNLDGFITNHFPKFLILCVVISILLIFITKSSDISDILYLICGGFVIGFTILGIFCSFHGRKKRRIDWSRDIGVFIIMPMTISFLLYLCGEDFYPAAFMTHYFDFLSLNAPYIDLTLSIMLIMIVTVLVSVAVISVIVGYFRSYMYRILRYIEKSKDDDDSRKRLVYRFFEIPDIIDVESVELNPEIDDYAFNGKLFVSLVAALFLLGMAVCSYIFLNPVLLQTIPSEEMLIIAIFISMFFSTLVIPWSIMMSIGAHVNSQARPFYLWKGMKTRLYQGFFAFAFIIMIVLMSAYFGMDFSRIIYTYLGYSIFMLMISIFTSYIYVNNYYLGFKNGIISSFYESRDRYNNETEDNETK